MATLTEALTTALVHHRAGRLMIAEELYRRILAAEPEHADALHLLGLVEHQTGRHPAAVARIRQAIALKPTAAAYYSDLGQVYRALGDLPEAVACYQRALQQDPHDVTAWNNLGMAHMAQDQAAEAVQHYRQALQYKPDYAEAWSNLGHALHTLGQLDEAVNACTRAVELRPNLAEAHNNLGNALRDQGQWDRSVVCYQQALQQNPDYPAAWNNLGNALAALGRLDDAITCYQRAVALDPQLADAHLHLGVTLVVRGRAADAVSCLQRALELRPNDPQAYLNLGTAQLQLQAPSVAMACFQRAVELQPDSAAAYNGLAVALLDQGRLDEALSHLERVGQLNPHNPAWHSNLLNTLQYRPGITLAELSARHAEYELRHAAPLRATWRPHTNTPDPERPLRLGIVSPVFLDHPVGDFLLAPLQHLDHEQYPVICYSDRMVTDQMTARLRAETAAWCEACGMNDEQLADRIRADGIDILIDAAGHTAYNRLLVFARKPAPIQITWLDYVGTTGLAAMDYILADRYEIPPESEPWYRERVLRLPDDYICYTPPVYMPAVGPLPALRRGAVTFSSFNFQAKINPPLIAVWARILRRLPGSRLLLQYRGLGDADTQAHFRRLFTEQGVGEEQVELRAAVPAPQLLATYNQVDLALDTFPYNGGLTTCEALWMGVPVITCPGETFAGRHALSHLTNVGLTETIARDGDEYVELAVSLATDLPRLAALRAGLREQMARSPLCDGLRFAQHLMALLRDVWRRWCARGDVAGVQ
jgi:protein O-GlcNAc transferase